MASPIWRMIAIVSLAIAVPAGGVTALQLYGIESGLYKPVAHDGMSPESVPRLRSTLIGAIVGSSVVSVAAGLYLIRSCRHPSA